MKKKLRKRKQTINTTSQRTCLSKFLITLGLLITFMVAVYFVSDILLKKDEGLNRVTLGVTNNEILASDIFNVDDDDYYVIVYNSHEDNLGMVSSISQKYTEEDIYVVDLAKAFNKIIISDDININTSDINNLRVRNEAIIKVENGKNVKSTDKLGKYKDFFE